VTFTAGSTVRSFAALVGADVGRARVASIGPVTSATVRELGMRVDVEAEEYTIPGLLKAIREFHTEAAG
jgi:uroporphyrinogen III methyltransferase/synthase